MKRLESLFLIFLSIVYGSLTTEAENYDVHINEDSLKRVLIDMSFGKGHLSGIMILKAEGDIVKGSVINEFGISALQMTYNSKTGKMSFQYLMGMLNKWYIKRTLKKDLAFIIHTLYEIPCKGKNRYEVTRKADEIIILNPGGKVVYNLKFLENSLNSEEGHGVD